MKKIVIGQNGFSKRVFDLKTVKMVLFVPINMNGFDGAKPNIAVFVFKKLGLNIRIE